MFLTPRYLAIAMEYAKGGDLYGYIVRNSPQGRLPEDHAKALFQQLILGLDFCHRMVSSSPPKVGNNYWGTHDMHPWLGMHCSLQRVWLEGTSASMSDVPRWCLEWPPCSLHLCMWDLLALKYPGLPCLGYQQQRPEAGESAA